MSLSCGKEEVDDSSFNATVLEIGLDCGNSFLIEFISDVPGLPENNFNNTFYEINLPDEYKVKGKKIRVEFREPTNGEEIICTNLGVSYPQIFITKVE
jgi:hypothetical protein